MPYRPRLPQLKQCRHCQQPFQSNHKRTVYCTSSCRTLAYKLRNPARKTNLTSTSAKGELNLSANNIGVSAVGSIVTAVGNYVLNDRPSHLDLKRELAELRALVKQLVTETKANADTNAALLAAIRALHPELGPLIKSASEGRKHRRSKHDSIIEKLVEQKRNQLADSLGLDGLDEFLKK